MTTTTLNHTRTPKNVRRASQLPHQKKINYDMIIRFVSKKNFWYLVVLGDDLSYCFDIKIEAERKITKKNVSGKWSPIVYMCSPRSKSLSLNIE
jgi:hypothetical protein